MAQPGHGHLAGQGASRSQPGPGLDDRLPPARVRGAWARVARAQGDDSSRWWSEQFPRQVDWAGDWRWTRAGLAGDVPASVNPR